MSVSPNTRIVTSVDLIELYESAYLRVQSTIDPEGPIDAAIPWEAANLFMSAVEFKTGVRPTCVYRGAMMGHLTHPGERAGREAAL